MSQPIEAAPQQAEVAAHPRGARRRRQTAFWLFWGQYAALFGIGLANNLLGLALLVAPWRREGRRLLHPRFQAVGVTLGVYVIALFAAVVASFDPATSARELTELFTLATVPLALLLVRSERQARWMVDAVVLLATAQALVAAVQLLDLGGADLSRRVHGWFSHYMTFAGILLIADLVLLAEIACGRKEGRWRWLALVPINAMLMASLTRSAWVGVAAGILVLLLFGRRRLLLAVLPIAVIVVSLPAQGAVLQRARSIFDPADPTNYDRLCMVFAGWEMIRERPVLGQGPLMVRERYPIYSHPTAPRVWVPHLHNSFLQLATERGLVSLFAYLGLMGVGLHRAMAGYRRSRRAAIVGGAGGAGPADLYLAVAAVLVGFNVAGLFEGNWGDTEVQRLALLMLALPFCLEAAEDQPPRAPGPPEGALGA
jgi:O-antigen ligase